MNRRCLGCMEVYEDKFYVCPHCGYVEGTLAEEAIHIEPGTLLHDRYIIGKVLGYGGFGVTYIGWDGTLQQKVAIKEYLPSEFSTRMPDQTQVTIFNGEKEEQFHDGMVKFVDEAKRLAKFQNESGIVKVFDSFIENQTAYIIMEYLEGETLADYLKREKRIPEDKAIEMLLPVIESLQVVHAEGILHRDIAPDNIFLTTGGEVKLIDFGASRYATTSHSRSLTVIIKPGYSPEEQYRSRGDQGAYTDIYALGATLYKMVTGTTPPDAMERRAKYESKNKDILEAPHKLAKGISPNRENAILNAMNVRIEDRTQDAATFMKELTAKGAVKRIYGKIKKIDLYSWPLWVKITLPAALGAMAVFIALMVTGVINFSFFTEEIVVPETVSIVPDVEGLDYDEAFTVIKNNVLLASTAGTVASEYISPGKVIIQDPVGGSYMDKNSTVCIVVSSGKDVVEVVNGIATMPYIITDSLEDALAKLKKAGFSTPNITEAYDDNIAANCVISQSLTAGKQVAENTVVDLVISLGPAAFEMMDVTGMNFTEAKNALEAKGLKVSIEYEKSDTVKENCVIRQSMEAGTEAKSGDSITLVVSSGKNLISIANVVGKTQEEAMNILSGQGFSVKVLTNYDNTVLEGYVISQSPAAGSSQIEGGEVNIYVSKGKRPINVTFDANGGSVRTTSGIVYAASAYGALPVPTNRGYVFKGWYTSASGGEKVTESTLAISESDHTLFAQWIGQEYQISFDGNGGEVHGGGISVTYKAVYGSLPYATRTGYNFAGWYDENGKEVTESTVFKAESNQTLTAQWTANRYMVYFEGNGGDIPQSSKVVTFGESYGSLGTPSRDGYTFDGWFTSSKGGSKVSANDIYLTDGNTTLYAQWTALITSIKFDANGGMVSVSSLDIAVGDTYGSLPIPIRDFYDFEGWYTSKSGGEQITESTVATGSKEITVYALWTEHEVSGWTLVQNVPSDAELIDRKWTYTETTYATSSQSTMPGFEMYNSTAEWSDYGPWSSWTTTPVSGSDSIAVETRVVVDGYNMEEYNTMTTKGIREYRSYSVNGNYSSYGLSSQYAEWHRTAYLTAAQLAACGTIDEGGYMGGTNAGYNRGSGTGYNVDGLIYFITSEVSHTEYRYRGRMQIFTYYFRKVEEKESSTLISSSNTISNVQEWVKYRPR